MSRFPSFTPTYHHEVYPAIDASKPELSTKGKVVLVTGAGQGIGKEIALTFARSGAKAVVLLGRTLSTLESTALSISKLGVPTSALVADVTSSQSVLSAFESAKTQFGSIDIVVANSGYYPAKTSIKDFDVDDWWRGFEVNTKGLFITTQAFLKTAGAGATLISVNTVAAHMPYSPGASPYQGSKLASLRFIEDVQAEHPEFRFFSFHPGVIATEMAAKAKLAGEDDVNLPASFAVWLVSPQANPFKGRLLWANWDVNELLGRQQEITSKNLLTTALKGWAHTVA